MNLEERYSASKLNARSKNYSGMTQLIADHSKLNIDRIPNKYNLSGKLINFSKSASQLDIDITPKKYKG